MRILILDDDRSYGALLASASKKLGHRAIIKVDAQEAVQLLRNQEADIALVDLQMPNLSGTAFAKTLRRNGITVPVAFCTGTCNDQQLIDEASTMGQVLPKIWTHADLRVVLSALQLQSHSIRRLQVAAAEVAEITERDAPTPTDVAAAYAEHPAGTSDEMATVHAVQDPSDALSMELPETQPAAQAMVQPLGEATRDVATPPAGKKRLDTLLEAYEAPREIQRVNIGCSNWEQVRRLCSDVMRGMTTITVRARCEMRPGEEVVVALELPDEMVVSIGARVIDFRERSTDGKRPYQLNLVGFGGDEMSYLLGCCDQHSPQSTPMMDSSQLEPPTLIPQQYSTGSMPVLPTPASLNALHPAAAEGGFEEPTNSVAETRIPEAIDSVETESGQVNVGPTISWS